MQTVSEYILKKLLYDEDVCKILIGNKEQYTFMLKFKHHIEQQTQDSVSMFVNTIGKIKIDIDDCINIDEPCWGTNDETFRQCLEMGHMRNNIELNDDRLFVCIYAKSNPDKYFVLMDSLLYISKKVVKGYRSIMPDFEINEETDLLDNTSNFYQNDTYCQKLMNVVNFVLHPDFYDAYLESKTKEQIKSDIHDRIDALQKEIEALKKQ